MSHRDVVVDRRRDGSVYAAPYDRRAVVRRTDPSPLSIAGIVLAGALLAVVGMLLLARILHIWPFETYQPAPMVAANCPRPGRTEAPPGFGDQQGQIRHLRQLGFRGDFFAQLDLGSRYEARREVDRNLKDPVEAAVWYALALTNPGGYTRVIAQPAPAPQRISNGPALQPIGSIYDQCRAYERSQASQALDTLWSRMSSDERDEVRKRIVYVLYSQGAPGLRNLARITSTSAGPYGQPTEQVDISAPPPRAEDPDLAQAPEAFELPVELFARNDVDAYLYSFLASQTGDIGGYVLLKDLEQSVGAGYADFVQAKANRWTPPFEFYPPESPASGVPHSDESVQGDDPSEAALARIGELPFIHVGRALAYLQVIPRPVPFERAVRPQDVRTLQAMLGRNQTGVLTPLEKVRAIQYAATNGSAAAQLALAVMYSEGVGVRADYARAFAWYERADKQGSPEAKFAIATFFSLGVEGIADQNKAEAVVYRLDSAMAGFRPSADRIRAVLAQVSRRPHS